MNTGNEYNNVNEPSVGCGVTQHDIITDISMLSMDKLYSYADYLKWQFKERVELIKGKIFKMSPAPASYHQILSSNLHITIGSYLRGKSCKIFSAPFDVRFPNGNNSKNTFTVVQPDICIICDRYKLDNNGCIGAPDLIIEILSPSTASKDIKNKFELYQENGVKEYWIVDPENKILDIFTLVNDKYQLVGKFVSEQTVSPVMFPDLKIDLNEIFE